MGRFSFPRRCAATEILTLVMLAGLVVLTVCTFQFLELGSNAGASCPDFVNYMRDAKSYFNTAHSLSEILVAFDWVLHGDPLGTYIRAKAQATQLEERRLFSRNHMQVSHDRTHRESTGCGQGIGPL